MSEATAVPENTEGQELTGAPVNAPDSGFGAGGNQQNIPNDLNTGIRTGVIPPSNVTSNPMGYQGEESQGPEQEQPSAQEQETTEAGNQQSEPTPEEGTKDKAPEGDFRDFKSVVGDLYEDPMTAPAAKWLESQLDGVDLDRAFGNTLRTGDRSLVDKHYLNEKLGDKAEQVMQYANMLLDYGDAKSEQHMQSIYSKFGGEDAAKKAGQYFSANAEPSTRDAITRMLDSGDKHLVEYAVQEIVKFTKASGGSVHHNTPAFGEHTVEQGISRSEFRSRSAAAKSEEEYTQLMHLYRLGQQQGL